MLTKISGYSTKFLCYVRNNFLSFLFKSSVFLTLLTLIYLVCVLKQSNSVQNGHQIEVQQVARSQKLISRIPTRTELPDLSTDMPATVYNLIPKARENMGSHSFFPIPESTTFGKVSVDLTSSLPPPTEETHQLFHMQDYGTPVFMSIDATPSLPSLETTTVSQPMEEQLFQEETTLPVIWSDPSLQELEDTTLSYDPLEKHLLLPVKGQHRVIQASEHITSTIDPTTTTHPLFPIQRQTTLPTEETTLLIPTSTTSTTELMETTPVAAIQEKTTSLWDLEESIKVCSEDEMTAKSAECVPFKRSLSLSELQLFGNAMDSAQESTTAESNPLEDSEEVQSTTNHKSDEITVTSSIPELPESNDPFGDNDDAEETDSLLPTDNSSEPIAETDPSDTYFEDDEGELNDLEVDHAEDPQPAEDEAMLPNSNEDRLPPQSTDPFGFEDNLFNLFNFDHLPAMSNINPTRWSSSDNAPNGVNTFSEAGEINEPPRFLQRLQSFQPVNSLLNMKIKDSVSLLHRLFSNFRR